MEFNWRCCFNNLTEREYLEHLMPRNFKYQVTSFQMLEAPTKILSENKFTADIKISTCTEQGLSQFIEEFQGITSTNYNIGANSDHKTGKSVDVTGRKKCIHNVKKGKDRKDRSTGMNTQCPSFLRFKLLKTDEHEHNSETDCDKFSCSLTINYQHNHAIECSTAYKYFPVSDETKSIFTQLFKSGYSASSAYNKHVKDLQNEHGDNFIRISADRSLLPDFKWTFNFFSNFVKDNFGAINSPESFKIASEKVKNYNELHGEELARLVQNPNGQFFVAVCDKLSRRVHEVNHIDIAMIVYRRISLDGRI